MRREAAALIEDGDASKIQSAQDWMESHTRASALVLLMLRCLLESAIDQGLADPVAARSLLWDRISTAESEWSYNFDRGSGDVPACLLEDRFQFFRADDALARVRSDLRRLVFEDSLLWSQNDEDDAQASIAEDREREASAAE